MAIQEVVLGLAGFGTVGSGLAKVLAENADLIQRRTGKRVRVARILVRDVNKRRAAPYPEGAQLTTTFSDLSGDPEIDIIVELMGGTTTAYELVSQALRAGKHVVTANKALLAERGQELFALAGANGVGLCYEASAVGAVPVIQTLKESLASNRIERLTGILNGTANYILSEMTTTGLDFDTALAKASELGYAEADPSLDIDGMDAAHKLILLIRLAYGVHYPLDELPVRGIRGMDTAEIAMARELGYRVKLIGEVRESEGSLAAGVYPALVHHTYLMARVGGNYNAVRVQGNASGPIMLHGQGAGDLPTASAVLADILGLMRNPDQPNNTGWVEAELPPARITPPEEHVSEHYFRFTVSDKPGVMATIARIMADEDISIMQAIQKGQEGGAGVPIVFTTHEATMRSVTAALTRIDTQGFVTRPSVHLRIL